MSDAISRMWAQQIIHGKAPNLAPECFCGDCSDGCANAGFKPCCGACMVGGPYDPDGAHFREARKQFETLDKLVRSDASS